MRRGAKPAKPKVGAKPPVAGESQTNEGARIQDLEKRLAEALRDKAEALEQLQTRDRELVEAQEQQTATAEILRVISSSPTDVQPVFDTIVKSVARLCDGMFASLHRFDGDLLHWVAQHNYTAEGLEAMRKRYPMRAGRDTASGRAVIDRTVIHIRDFENDPDAPPSSREIARAFGYRSLITVPMLREGLPVGAIAVARRDGPFSAGQIQLLQTFADQAVIAIENVRLFNETKEALERQTATAEILRLIAGSPTDLGSVLGTVAETAMRVCGARDAIIYRCDGDVLRLACTRGPLPVSPSSLALPLNEKTATGRSVVERRTIHVHDLAAVAASEYPEALSRGVPYGSRTVLATPLLQDGEPLGAILIRRGEVQAFTDKQIALLETFADQAVIAIENVRLFSELQASNRDLRAALDTQTATSDILRVISRSQTDVRPVFDAIVASAIQLLAAHQGVLTRIVGDQLELAAATFTAGGEDPTVRARFPRPVRGGVHGQAIRDRAPVNIADAQTGPGVSEELRAVARALGYRSLAAVPLLRHDEAIGTIAVVRRESGGFTPDEIALLKTFADQAVIAIENARLFRELEEKNQALTQAHAEVSESLEQQTATSEVLRVISVSPTDAQPVFDAIARSAMRLCHGDFCNVARYDGELLHLVAYAHASPEGIDMLKGIFPMRPTRATVFGRTTLEKGIVHIPDVRADAEFAQPLAKALHSRSGVGVPMLREGQLIGVIGIGRHEVQAFTDQEIALLKTFADQAVIAIENVRLFTELQQKNKALTDAHAQVTEALEQQTATSEILRVISRSQTDVQPVFDAIITSVVTLCDGLFGVLYRFDGEMMHQVAQHNYGPDALAEVRRTFPARPSRALTGGRAILERRVVNLPDIELDPEYQPAIARAAGARSVLAVPMLREGAVTGAIAVGRAEPGPFSDSHVELLKTFADQAVIAVENVRLFTELRDRTAQLGRSVDELTALGQVSQALSSTLELETVLTTIVQRAIELSGADGGSVYEYDDTADEFHLRATRNFEEELVEAARTMPLRRGEGALGLVAEQRRPVQFPDISDPAVYQSPVRETLMRTGYRAVLALPMLRDDRLVGALAIGRKSVGQFAPGVIDLLTTFANQATLAMQNARLFRELADKSRQLEMASQHKSEFLANMSHELRTPLNAIIGFSEVLSERMFGELNEKQEEYLKDIHASGQHLLSLINDILDLSKIEAGRMELELSEFHLPTALDSAVTLVGERARRRSIALHMNVDEQIGQIQADERKIRQVVLNLLSNAIKFTTEGGRIDVAAIPKDGSVEVSVSDTGVGIAPEDQEAVFEEFRQVGTADKKVEGTGLGLTLCRKFVELHGGKIWVKSEVGVGSTFTFTIPVRSGE